MKAHLSATAVLAILAAIVQLRAADEAPLISEEIEGSAPIGAPVHYADTTVILADDQGTACVRFRCPPSIEHNVSATSDLVEYQYRFRANDGSESSGQGLVYENYRNIDGDESTVVDDGGQLKVLAGHFEVEWSKGDMKQGWLYYTPETLQMQFAASRSYDKLNLSRFGHQEQRTKR